MGDSLKKLTFTGPPILGGWEFPHPTKEFSLEPEWIPNHIIKRMGDGSIRVKRRQWILVFRLGWKGLSQEDMENLVLASEKGSVIFIPRSQNGSDTNEEGGTEPHQYEVRFTSPIAFDTPNRPNHKTYDIEIELQAVSSIVGAEAAGGGAATPTEPEAGYKAWFVAQDVADLQADGTDINTWDDRTGTYTATQKEAVKLPTISHNALNGKAVARFEDAMMSVPPAAMQPLGKASCTWFCVVQPKKTTGVFTGFIDGSWGNGSNYGVGYGNNSQWVWYYAKQGSSNANRFIPMAANSAEVLIAAGRNNADGTVTYWINGVKWLDGGTRDFQASLPVSGNFGEVFVNNSGPGSFDLAEVITYDALLTDEQVHNTIHYLCGQYGETYNRIDTIQDFVDEAGEDLLLFSRADQINGYSDGDPVTSIPDLSINGNDMTVRDTGDPPIYHASRIKGLPALQFNATTTPNLIAPGTAIPVVEDDVYVVTGAIRSGAHPSQSQHMINANSFLNYTAVFTGTTQQYSAFNTGSSNIQSIHASIGKATVVGGSHKPNGIGSNIFFYLEYDSATPHTTFGQTASARAAVANEVSIGHRYTEGVGIDRFWGGDLFGWAILRNPKVHMRMAAHMFVRGDYVTRVL